jgi:signal transduction histidine kinase
MRLFLSGLRALRSIIALPGLLLGGAAFAQSPLIDSLERVVNIQPADTNTVKALTTLASELMRRDIQKAKLYSMRQLVLARQLSMYTSESGAYAVLVTIHYLGGHQDSSRYYLDLHERLYKEHPVPKIAINYNNSAGLYYRERGQYREALPYMLAALEAVGENGDQTQRAGQLLNLGNTYRTSGDTRTATTYHLKALALFEKVGNKRGQSFCLQGLGNNFKDLRQYSVAEEYLLRSEKMKEELGDKRGLVSAWMSLGALYQDMNEYDRSLAYATKGYEGATELKLTSEQGKFLYNIASVTKSLKKPEEARLRYNEALVIIRQTGDSLLVSRIKTDLIMLDGELRKNQQDEAMLLNNVRLTIEEGDRSLEAEGHSKLADWYSNRGEFQKAFEHLKTLQALTDSIRGNEVQLQIKKLEEEYLGEKKDKEISLLKKDRELQDLELSRQRLLNTAIVTALVSVLVIGFLLVNWYRGINKAKRAIEIERVRNSIARDLHDEMGSALSSINILSQVALVEKGDNTQNYLQRIGDQSARMMENMGDMVWSINPRNDSMQHVLTRMREFATEILDPMNIDYQFTDSIPADLVIPSDKRKNLFLIFKESVNNAAKYSAAGKVEINLAQQNGSLVMNIKDDGKGFDEVKTREGNGLRNMRERAAESGGTVTIRSASQLGTSVELRLPIT